MTDSNNKNNNINTTTATATTTNRIVKRALKIKGSGGQSGLTLGQGTMEVGHNGTGTL